MDLEWRKCSSEIGEGEDITREPEIIEGQRDSPESMESLFPQFLKNSCYAYKLNYK